MTKSQPLITRTAHTLSFDKLSPRDFERLCLWLVRREGYERAEHLGASGGEQGRDIVAWRKGRLWAFQCKRVRRFGPRDALEEVEKVLALPEAERPVGLVFLVTCDVSAQARKKARARCAEEKLECRFWVGTELDERVKRYPDIVEEFFGADSAARPVSTLSTAPAPPAHFTGRGDELDELAQALATDDTPQAITALQGMGGIGKTALAAQLAAQLNGALPGGVFWADLPANRGDPLPVLAAWARLCGHDVSTLADPQARAQAVRGILAGRVAERGRLLVVLDDVRVEWLDGARVLGSARPPGVPLLLTTRQARVAQALRAHVTRLDTLSPDEARELLATLTGDTLTGGDAERIAELCGHLPLALEIAAAAAVEEGAAWLLGRLADAATRLDALALDDASRKEESIRLTFDVSYRALAERYPETGRAFRCLGAFAAASIRPQRLAGVLAGGEGAEVDEARVDEADGHLRRLARWALVRREPGQAPPISNLQPPIPNLQSSILRLRSGQASILYSLHPLLRDYAAALLKETGEGPATRAAHTAHYLAYAEAHDGATAADYDALEAERPNLLYTMDRAYREEQWPQVRGFAWALCDPASGYLSVRGYWGELRARLEQAVRAAEAEGHQRDAAAFAGNLATLLKNTGDLAAARQEYQRVLAIFEELGERKTVAIFYHQLGVLAQAVGEHDEARRLYRQSLEIEEELGNRADIAGTLHQLGVLAQATGEYDEARQLYRQSLEISEELGNRAGIALTLWGLAMIAQDQGDLAEARRQYEEALVVFQELGDKKNEAGVLHELGRLAQAVGELDEARQLYGQSLEINEELGNRAGIAQTLGAIAIVAQREGDLAEAESLYRQAMIILQEIGDVVNASIHMFNLALLCEAQGRLDEALDLLERSLAIKERVGSPLAEQDRRVLERVRGKLGG